MKVAFAGSHVGGKLRLPLAASERRAGRSITLPDLRCVLFKLTEGQPNAGTEKRIRSMGTAAKRRAKIQYFLAGFTKLHWTSSGLYPLAVGYQCLQIFGGIVAMAAPINAASLTLLMVLIDAAKICVLKRNYQNSTEFRYLKSCHW